MKNFKVFLFYVVLGFVGIGFTACDSGTKSATEQQGKEYTSAYVCPMHCKDSGSDKEGTCPVCNMDYVKNTDHKADGHKH